MKVDEIHRAWLQKGKNSRNLPWASESLNKYYSEYVHNETLLYFYGKNNDGGAMTKIIPGAHTGLGDFEL